MLQAFLFSEDVTNMKNLEESTGCAPMPGLWWRVGGGRRNRAAFSPRPSLLRAPAIHSYVYSGKTSVFLDIPRGPTKKVSKLSIEMGCSKQS